MSIKNQNTSNIDDLIIEIEDSEDENNFIDLQDYTTQSEDLNSVEDLKNKNNSFFFKKEKKNIKNSLKTSKDKNSNFIDLEENNSFNNSNFVIIGDKRGKFRNFIFISKILFYIFIAILLSAIIFFSISYKIIPESIKGSNYDYKNYSIVSKNYQPNLDELKIGDKIVCLNEKSDWIPFNFDYEIYTCKDRSGAFIKVEDKEGKIETIQSVDIDYILR